MRSEWRVSTQYFEEGQVWQVYYLRDVNAVDHGGNRVYYPEVFYDSKPAQAAAERLNADADL